MYENQEQSKLFTWGPVFLSRFPGLILGQLQYTVLIGAMLSGIGHLAVFGQSHC